MEGSAVEAGEEVAAAAAEDASSAAAAADAVVVGVGCPAAVAAVHVRLLGCGVAEKEASAKDDVSESSFRFSRPHLWCGN